MLVCYVFAINTSIATGRALAPHTGMGEELEERCVSTAFDTRGPEFSIALLDYVKTTASNNQRWLPWPSVQRRKGFLAIAH